MIPFITVDYNEGADIEHLDYRGVVLNVGGKEVKRANSGNFLEDYNEIINYVSTHFDGLPCMGSSSIEHFIADAQLSVCFDDNGDEE